MPTDHRTELRAIRTFPSLVKYLRDEMDWPISSDDFEDLTFDYTPEELGIDASNAAKIKEIRRLRPLSVDQPWGIFFVMFEPKRLPVVALRRILSRVALKKRASADSGPAWQVDDLLFISNYGEGDQRQISFAHFSQDKQKNDLPTLKVLGWDNLDTPLHLDHIADTLTDSLAWPEDEEDTESWRETWSSAFTIRHREVITTSRALAVALADLARSIRKRISTVLAIENEDGPVTKLMVAFKESLIHDLDDNKFATMYAQTIAYGLLSARVSNPRGCTADDFSTQMPVTNPFLKELMETFLDVGGRKVKMETGTGIDFDELGVSEVVELLDNANMEAVVRDFGDRNPQEDPVIHFYELFLKEYDAKERMDRGVFYTPRPVVSFIVRSVDELLCEEFGLENGLADTSTWGEMAARHVGLEIPDGAKPEEPFVQILDPATGTGTFLVEVIDLIYKTMTERWTTEGHMALEFANLWNDYVPKHLLPRLHGYELLMAPYAIAHMKVGLKLYETGYRFESDERARVYLTNALEPAQDFSGTLTFAIPALAHEAEAVNAVKRDKRFTVVVGNPPYSGHSANASTDERGRRIFIGELMHHYQFVDGEPLGEKNSKWLQDDYVKFMRFGEYLIQQTEVGVMGFITNHSYLDNPTFRGMRRSLMHSWNTVRILDLHGNSKKKETSPDGSKDENVFDIQQGVGISIHSKTCRSKHIISHHDLWGSREHKYSILGKDTFTDIDSVNIQAVEPFYLFIPQNYDVHEEYMQYTSLKTLMPISSMGFVTSRDSFVISFDRDTLLQRFSQFRDLSVQEAELEDLSSAGKLNIAKARAIFSKRKEWSSSIIECQYRLFDRRYICYADELLERSRRSIMRHMRLEGNIAMLVSRQVVSEFRHVFSTKFIANFNTIDTAGRFGSGPFFPLYVSTNSEKTSLLFGGDRRRPNIDRMFLEALAGALHITQTGEYGLPRGVSPEDIFNYIYAVLHSRTYRSRYVEFLKRDFPRIPLPRTLENFLGLARLGGKLVALHTLESQRLDTLVATYEGTSMPQVEKVSYSDETVWLDKAKTQGFKGVMEEVWNFRIGGYQVCEKWLKDRQAKGGKNPHPGRVLTTDDIDHYQKIVVALSETIRIMAEIDEVIEKHGGWPGAFESASPPSEDQPKQPS